MPALLVLFAGLVLFVSGCNTPKDQLAAFDRQFVCRNYEQSAAFAQEKIRGNGQPKGEDLLWTLQLGSVERMRYNYEKSSDYFDKAEDMLKFFDEQSNVGETVLTTAINDNAIPYKGEEYDGVMVNTYKALNFMAMGKPDLARVEFNRALDRQRRAKDVFANEIVKLNEEIEDGQKKNNLTKSNIENPQTREIIEKNYPNLSNFNAYPDFVNPFATYMAGVYFNLIGDHSKAVDLLKESYGMAKNNSFIADDLACTEMILSGKQQLDNTVWLIFENGLGPAKDEVRIDLPLFVVTDQVRYFGIALPKLRYRPIAYSYLTVEAGGQGYNTQVVADMDSVVHTEFKKEFGMILTRAIISASVKAAAQYALQKNSNNNSGGQWAAIAMAIYSAMTTAADVRIWTALPKDFQVARFAMPADNRIRIMADNTIIKEIELPDCNNAIIYVKIPTKCAEPIYQIMTF